MSLRTVRRENAIVGPTRSREKGVVRGETLHATRRRRKQRATARVVRREVPELRRPRVEREAPSARLLRSSLHSQR